MSICASGDKPDDTMWASSCTLSVNLDQPNFYHTCDEASGNSGSPMFVNYKKAKNGIPAGARWFCSGLGPAFRQRLACTTCGK